MFMNDYQKEQMETLLAVRKHLAEIPAAKRDILREKIQDYLVFRRETAAFLAEHFAGLCTRNCYENRLSACCSKDGIIAFFADTLISALLSSDEELNALEKALCSSNSGFKCVWLSEKGCIWKLKPIVCEMFLCDAAKKEILGKEPRLEREWEKLEEKKKRFTWPDRPVLFDELEEIFMDAGYRTATMYLHNSPGLLRIKKISGMRKEEK